MTEITNWEVLSSSTLPREYAKLKIRCSACDSLFTVYLEDFKKFHYCPNCGSRDARKEKGYTKADYIMALHKEYGCDFVAAEEAHDMALEYLRSLSKMKG